MRGASVVSVKSCLHIMPLLLASFLFPAHLYTTLGMASEDMAALSDAIVTAYIHLTELSQKRAFCSQKSHNLRGFSFGISCTSCYGLWRRGAAELVGASHGIGLRC